MAHDATKPRAYAISLKYGYSLFESLPKSMPRVSDPAKLEFYLTSPSLSGRSVEVIVGAENPVTFSVHENIICRASHFFKKSMDEVWIESQERLVRLKSDDPDVFRIYVHWLYRDTLPVRIDSPGYPGNAEYMQLAQAYVLGDFLQDANFKDAVLDAFLEKRLSETTDGSCWYPIGPVVRHIYDNTRETSKARRLLVDLYTENGQGNWLTEWASPEDLPKEFLLDLAVALLDNRTLQKSTTSSNPCRYHEHTPDGSPCYTLGKALSTPQAETGL